MSLNKSLRHARTARRQAAHQMRDDLIVWIFGIALVVILIGVVSR
jgi:hypothetical protein